MELGNLIFGHSRGNYPIDRKSFENTFSKDFTTLLEAINCDSYGYYNGYNKSLRTNLGGFKCDLFEINPYYWGDCDCGADETCNEHHKDTCSLVIPNFIYKAKTGETIEIRWYKYPFRDSYSNVEISKELFSAIMKNCISFVKTLNV